MGEPSDIKAGGIEAEGVAPATGDAPAASKSSLRQWIVDHWRGELSLGDAFWTNGVILNILIDVLDWGLDRLSGDEPHWLWMFVLLPLGVFELVVPLWQVVGVWRSAGRFPGRQLADGRFVGRRLWSVAARVIAVIWAIETLILFASIFK